MNITSKIICFFVFLSLVSLYPPTIPAEELHVWVDENGATHVTDRPPKKPAKIIGREAYKPTSPEEIQQYQDEQRYREEYSEAQHKRNQEIAEADREKEKYKKQQAKKNEKRAIARKKAEQARIEDLEAEKKRLRAIENKNYREARRIRIEKEKRQIERAINDIDD